MSRLMGRASLGFALLVASTAAAAAEPHVADDGAQVIVSIAGVKAMSHNLTPHGDRIELAIEPGAAPANAFFDDVTVKRVQIVGGETPRLIVGLHHGRTATEHTAAQAHLDTQNGMLRLILPREPHHAAGETETESPAAITAVAPASRATPISSESPHALHPMPTNPSVVNPPPAAPSLAARPEAPPLWAPEPRDSGSPMRGLLMSLGGMGALAVGGIGFLRRRRALPGAPQELLRVIAQRSLGGRAKLMLVQADRQRMLLAISDKETRLLGRWDEGATIESDLLEEPASNDTFGGGPTSFGGTPALAAATKPYANEFAPASQPAPRRRNSTSPAVAGLLKLRQQDHTPELGAGTIESDAAWVRELLSATKRGGGAQG